MQLWFHVLTHKHKASRLQNIEVFIVNAAEEDAVGGEHVSSFRKVRSS